MDRLLQENLSWKRWGAFVGLCGGFAAPVAGSAVTLISWLSDPVWHGFALHQAGTILFVVTLPLLIFGAHCLDLLDQDKMGQ